MKIMSKGMSVFRIQKLCTTWAGKMNSIPFPSGSSLRHIRPRLRSGLVSAISTISRCAPPKASRTTRSPRSGGGPFQLSR